MKAIVVESNNDIVSQYSSSGTRIWRGGKSEDLFFHFYDVTGETLFIMPWRSLKEWIPPAPERLTDEYEASPKFNRYDKIAKSYLISNIENSLYQFEREAEFAPTRDQVRKKNGFNVGRVLDESFSKWFAWDLLKNSTGESYAWGTKKDPKNMHIGQTLPPDIFTGAESNLKLDTQQSTQATYTFKFYNEDGVNTYIIPFEPKGAYSFGDPRWRKIAQIPVKELKDRKTEQAKVIFKFLNEAISAYIDRLISISDMIQSEPTEDKKYPINGLDNDFEFASWELFRNDEPLAFGTRSNYIHIGKRD